MGGLIAFHVLGLGICQVNRSFKIVEFDVQVVVVVQCRSDGHRKMRMTVVEGHRERCSYKYVWG